MLDPSGTRPIVLCSRGQLCCAHDSVYVSRAHILSTGVMPLVHCAHRLSTGIMPPVMPHMHGACEIVLECVFVAVGVEDIYSSGTVSSAVLHVPLQCCVVCEQY